MIEINVINSQDTINKEELNEKFFNNTLDIRELNDAELKYYHENLDTVTVDVTKVGYIYFDCQKYSIVKGWCNYHYNSKKQLTKKRYKIIELFNVGINEQLSKIINDIFDSKNTVFTNIHTDSLLGRDIIKKGKFNIGRNTNTKTEIEIKLYQDLIGAVENQNDIGEPFFITPKSNDPKLDYVHRYGDPETLFLQAIDAITSTPEGTTKFPSEIIATINWFGKFPNIM